MDYDHDKKDDYDRDRFAGGPGRIDRGMAYRGQGRGPDRGLDRGLDRGDRGHERGPERGSDRGHAPHQRGPPPPNFNNRGGGGRGGFNDRWLMRGIECLHLVLLWQNDVILYYIYDYFIVLLWLKGIVLYLHYINKRNISHNTLKCNLSFIVISWN